MNKIEILEKYIENIEYVIKRNDEVMAEKLIKTAYSTFLKEIEDLYEGLTCYFYGVGSYIEDLKILKARLSNYESNLLLEKEKRDYELRKMELQNMNSSTGDQYRLTNSDIQGIVTYENIIANLNSIQDDSLSEEEREKLEDMLATIELAKNSRNKSKIINKIESVLKFISNKDANIGMVVLPYLGDTVKFLKN